MYPITPIALSVPEAAKAIGIGRTKMFELIAGEDIKAIKIGRRTLVPATELTKFISSNID